MSKRFSTARAQAFLGETYQSALATFEWFILAERRWSKTGVWQQVFEAQAADADNEDALIDATIVRAHQHSALAEHSTPEQEAIGRSKGGLSTKIHAVTDALGNPTHFF